MRIVIIQRGSKDPHYTHTYFIDDRETIENLGKLIKTLQNLAANQKQASSEKK